MNETLLAGPWVGEFGWELFHWQGLIRTISRDFDKTIVIGRPGHEVIYEDFCDDYIVFDPESYMTDGWRCFNKLDHTSILNAVSYDKYIDGTTFDIGGRYTGEGVKDKMGLWHKQTFYKYNSDRLTTPYDLILHARYKHSGERSHERNWSEQKWNLLISKLDHLSVASIGTTQSSLHIKGTDDCRGMSLRDTINLLCCGKLALGPSSGPMHLASLCGTPHLVWSTMYNKNRYEESWNPHNTPVYFYGEQGWNPGVDNILNMINNIIDD